MILAGFALGAAHFSGGVIPLADPALRTLLVGFEIAELPGLLVGMGIGSATSFVVLAVELMRRRWRRPSRSSATRPSA